MFLNTNQLLGYNLNQIIIKYSIMLLFFVSKTSYGMFQAFFKTA